MEVIFKDVNEVVLEFEGYCFNKLFGVFDVDEIDKEYFM